ncbi:ABC transporter permease subunit [Mesorhizobium sp. B3-1-3]|uniref:ABC transporter permease subunit n=1 Tax=unclassified Mesorhizobium TaxID=325217 RepID=UPI0011268EEF|nr:MULTISPECIES: ABC transporter permease subunit [unclassified Mesorhizobium]TPI67145.1 ABC transporter permease subunit [Mesorhizobium sp. B3-1-8]TPI70375.1 ABC transporter permease subunit [Mesorhizobium sp. B3-1-3]
MRHRPNRAALLVLPGLLFLTATFLFPLSGVLLRSFDPDGRLSFAAPRFALANYADLVADPLYRVILQNTFLVAIAATAATLLLAYPVCFFMSRLPKRWASALLLLALFPFWTSILVRLFAFTQILPLFGLMYTTTATVIGMVYYLLPYMIAVLYATMIGIDGELINAARTLGASLRQALLRIFMPLTRPGVMVGSTMVFVISLGFFLTPAILGGGADLTVSTYIQQQVNIARWGNASAMGTALLAITLVLFYGFSRTVARDDAVILGGGSQKGVSRTERLQLNWPIGFSLLITVVVFVFLLAPLAIVVMLSVTSTTYLTFPPKGFSSRWYADFFHDPDWLASAWLSLKVAALTAITASALGLLTAIGIVRGNLPFGRVIAALFLAPLIVPVILIAIALFDLANRLHLVGTVAGYVTGHTLLALPVTVLIVSNALRSSGTEIEQAARTLGASQVRAFLSVTAPMIAPSLVVAAIFAFVTSWDEPVVALFLSTGRTTLPVHVFNHIQTEVTPTVAAVSTMLMAVVLIGGLAYATLAVARTRRLIAGG